MDNPCDKLNSLGRVCSYRTDTESVQAAVDLMRNAFDGYQAELETKQTVEERAIFALEVVQRMLSVSSGRAGDCIEQHTQIACENVDMFDLLAKWVSYAKHEVPAAASSE